MSIYKKYASCGCNSGGKTYGTSCCKTPVADPPCPLCESHVTILKPQQCFLPACNVTATDETFFIKFKDVEENQIPLNATEVFLYHAVAGLLNIHSFSGASYEVSLVDPTKAGSVIAEDDCVLVAVVPETVFTSTSNQRCLCGKFNPPALNATETIYIFNGTGIAIGSTLTFTANGETGSYLVQSFDGATGSTYAYTVQNTGNGHTPGSIIDGGVAGACLIPIEIVTETDLCSLSESQTLDQISGCLNGSPRSLTPTAEGQVPIAASDLSWELQRFTNTDCCFFIEGCLKFQADEGCISSDTAIVREPVPECLQEKIDAGFSGGDQPIPIQIDGREFVITAYNSVNREISIAPKDDSIFGSDTFIEFPDGTELCFGECCNTCVGGAQITDPNTLDSDPILKDGAVVAFQLGDVTYEDGQFRRYMIGIPQATATGLVETQFVDATFNDNPSDVGPGVPRMSDNLIFRQKICNTSAKGCNQLAEIVLNFELSIGNLPDNVAVYYEVGHFAYPAPTLEDGTTPNPFTNISSQAAEAGQVRGPGHEETEFITGTAIGPGNASNNKNYPYIARTFSDTITLQRCDCANSMVWLFLKVEADPGAGNGALFIEGSVRRIIRKLDQNFIPYPINDPQLPE